MSSNRDRILATLLILTISMSMIVGLSKSVLSQSESTWIGGTIYIRADGSVEPSDAPIVTHDYETYTMTSNILIVEGPGIVVERDNIVLDGNGHTLRGTGSYEGIRLYGRTNITIRNLAISEFSKGLYVTGSSEIVVFNNTVQVIVVRSENIVIKNLHISNTTVGIQVLWASKLIVLESVIEKTGIYGIGIEVNASNNIIIGENVISSTATGIYIGSSENLEVLENTIESAVKCGIRVLGSNSVMVKKNSIRYIAGFGVCVDSSNEIAVERNIITNTGTGLFVVYSPGTIVADNYFENTVAGARIFDSNEVIVRNNIVVNNSEYGLEIQRSSGSYIINNTIHNVAAGIHVFGTQYSNLENNEIVNVTYEGVKLAGSMYNTIKRNTIMSAGTGISAVPAWGWSDANNIVENTIERCSVGILLYDAWFNYVMGNTIRDNYVGVELWWVQSNTFLYNNFVNNTYQVYLGYNIWYNAWNDGFVGNYWSDHICVDEDENGVCDNPYIISYPYNVDWRPSKYPYPFEVVSVSVHTLVTFVRASGGDVWFGLISEDGDVEWRPLGGIVADAPSATFYKGRVYVVARSEDGALWYGVLSLPKWDFSGWRPIPGLAASKPSIVATDYGIVICVRDFNNGIWIGLLSEDDVIWYSIPGLTLDTPALTYVNGTLHIVVRGLDGYTIWHGTVELPSFEFKGWRQVYGSTNSAPELLAVGNTLYLAVRDLGNGVALATYNKLVGWLGWVFIPGGLTDTQPNLAYFNEELIILVKAYNDQSIWLARKDHYGYWNWTNIPGLTTHEPELVSVSLTYVRVVPKT